MKKLMTMFIIIISLLVVVGCSSFESQEKSTEGQESNNEANDVQIDSGRWS